MTEAAAMTKRCSSCGEDKALDEFSNHRREKDGKQTACKSCRSEMRREWEAANRDRVRGYAEKDREKTRAKQRKYNARHPEKRRSYERRRRASLKVKAREALQAAVRFGKITKPTCCQDCGCATEARLLHGHHPDYNKPLDVEWLCSVCHGKRHRLDQEGTDD